MIAVIADIMSSREVDKRERQKMDEAIRYLLDHTYERFQDYCLAVPALTQGDSIELLVNSWQPVVFLFHNLLMEDFEFRVGFGTGEVIIMKANADECDGPVFWNAREALDEIKTARYMSSSAGFKFAVNTSDEERNLVINTILLYVALLGLTTTQLRYCFHYIWKKKHTTEIAEVTGTSKGNVSRILGNTPCYLIEKVMTFLSQ